MWDVCQPNERACNAEGKKGQFFGPWRSKLGEGEKEVVVILLFYSGLTHGPSFPKRVFCFMCVCVSACDSKFDNLFLLLACSVYDNDSNPI